MMTEDEYKTRLAVAIEMRNKEIADDDGAGSIRAHLADLALDALNDQWKRSQAARRLQELAADSARLEWMITREAAIWKHPEDSQYTCSIDEELDYYGNTARQAIDAAMKDHP